MLRYENLLRELVLELRVVCDDANHATADLEVLNRLRDDSQRVGIEGAEAFVDEEAVQVHGSGSTLNLIAQLKGKG